MEEDNRITRPNVHRNINADINGRPANEVDMEAILDVMGCKTRRDIMDLLREEPRFVSEISQELQIGQKAIIEHLRAMEEIGILESSFKKVVRGRPRKYYDMPNDVNVTISITRNSFNVAISDDMMNIKQLPSGDEWSKLLAIEKRIIRARPKLLRSSSLKSDCMTISRKELSIF